MARKEEEEKKKKKKKTEVCKRVFLRVERGLLLHLLSILWDVPPSRATGIYGSCLYISSQIRDFQDPCDRSSPFSAFTAVGKLSQVSWCWVVIRRSLPDPASGSAAQSKGEGHNYLNALALTVSRPRIALPTASSKKKFGSPTRTASLSFPPHFSIIIAGQLMSRSRRRRRPKLPLHSQFFADLHRLSFCI